MVAVSVERADRLVAGRYRLRRKLGQGSMGIVWEAYDEFLRRRVAVKEVLRPPGLPDQEADELRERTLREARAIAALSHPNVITLHDVAREGGEPFVVTEYVRAHSLAELLRALGPLETSKVAAIGDAIAAGLGAAHQVGITHRDVKPGNVLVCDDGQVKLTDFGIARNVSEKTITRTGVMLGSPCYIAPEVAAGDAVTPAADLWGLGTTLFAAVEGEPPYNTGGGVLEIINEVVHGEIPRPTHADGPLVEIIAALMVKEPGERITLAELRNRLHPLLPPPSTPLLSAQDLHRLDGSTGDEAPTKVTPPLVAPPTPPVPEPAAPALAPAPGPLPFSPQAVTPRRHRGPAASVALTLVAVLLFAGAASGGFALARVAGGEPLLPPSRTSAPPTTPQPEPPPDELVEHRGDAATVVGAQGGSYLVKIPVDWIRFVEERRVGDLASTRVYFVSPDGTRTFTVERFADFYASDTIKDYLSDLGDLPNVVPNSIATAEVKNLVPNATEQALQLVYRTTDHASVLAPGDPRARNQNRVTFANAYPVANDLWVVGVTVPVDQEDTGRRELFDRLIATFKVTG
ncbi:hypothetical protein BLA60_39985 [Actinophytocola xinjiangensis]|uniref:non-specific serine/threonine protein kinase n=1 Tax=Actinophytocola xinjiangensis TaxID=485602 RepID=A0A7Z1AUU6_9PSEU|nr:serine/threonine-protein kinase [Actinophytocola xinjiangensis]OLF04587.1 hypothetical protein BLA60_39985 [Actinophytocola xinjiangensis]